MKRNSLLKTSVTTFLDFGLRTRCFKKKTYERHFELSQIVGVFVFKNEFGGKIIEEDSRSHREELFGEC